MEKPIIGIIGPRFDNHLDPFLDYTKFVSNYSDRIVDAGGIPIGLLFPYNKFNIDEMDLCDGFIFTGGATIESSQVMAIHYALMNHKPFLGICMGMQTMAAYEWFNKNNNLDYEFIDKNYDISFEDNFLEKVNGHNNLDIFRIDEIDKTKHKVKLFNSASLLFDSDFILVPSVHSYMVKKGIFGDIFEVCGRSLDGVIECVKKPDEFMVGVQFHPELEGSFLFEKLVDEAFKIKKKSI